METPFHTPFSQLGRRVHEPPIGWLMRLALERPELISLAAGFTDYETLPVAEVQELCRAILTDSARARHALQYGTTAGLPELRKLTAERIIQLEKASIPAVHTEEVQIPQLHPEEVIITNGSQQMLYLISEVLCDPGDIVIVEDPTYFVYLGIVQGLGLACRGVPLKSNGMDPAGFDRLCSELERTGQAWRVKLVYLVTYHQNPTGRSTDLETKRYILERLSRLEEYAGHRIYLIEDAAYREMGFSRSGAPSALVFEPYRDRVIYVGTYSKPFATGIRLGFGIVPEPVRSRILYVKNNHDFGSPNFLQYLLAEAIRSGVYEKHLSLIRARYAEKAELMHRSLQRWMPERVRWTKPEGGMYFWLEFPEEIHTGVDSPLFKEALKQGVLYVPGSMCYADDPARPIPDHQIRLSFGNATLQEIERGIERLGLALNRIMTPYAG